MENSGSFARVRLSLADTSLSGAAKFPIINPKIIVINKIIAMIFLVLFLKSHSPYGEHRS